MIRVLGPEHPDTRRTRYNLVLLLKGVDPAASRPHIDALRRIGDQPAASLSAVEREILAALPALSGGARAATPQLPALRAPASTLRRLGLQLREGLSRLWG
jgi:hypothetical protein